MARKTLPSRDLVRQLLRYDVETGEFTWLSRPREMFVSKHNCGTWHTRYAGKQAGCTTGPGGYHIITLASRMYYLHRLAWLYVYGEPVPVQIDHIDRDKLNNRIGNLRAATPSQNQANKLLSPNAIGIKGVRRYKGSFRAHIRVDGKGLHLGTFKTSEEAAKAYQEAAVRLFGEFAKWD